jgi:parvulin-like peptidyl-prolyl isomerase
MERVASLRAAASARAAYSSSSELQQEKETNKNISAKLQQCKQLIKSLHTRLRQNVLEVKIFDSNHGLSSLDGAPAPTKSTVRYICEDAYPIS